MGNLTRGFTDEILSLSAEPIIGAAANEKLSTELNRIAKFQDIPVRLYANSTPTAVLNIAANRTQAGDGTYRSVAPESSTLPSLAAGSINFDTGATTGTVKRDGATFSLPSLSTTGKYVRVALVYSTTLNSINTTFSAEAASQGALADVGTLFDLIDGQKIGYIDLVSVSAVNKFKTASSAGSSPLIENADITLFGSGAGGGGGGLSVTFIDHTFTGTLQTGKHYILDLTSKTTSDLDLNLPAITDKKQVHMMVIGQAISGFYGKLIPNGTDAIWYDETAYLAADGLIIGKVSPWVTLTGKVGKGWIVEDPSNFTSRTLIGNWTIDGIIGKTSGAAIASGNIGEAIVVNSSAQTATRSSGNAVIASYSLPAGNWRVSGYDSIYGSSRPSGSPVSGGLLIYDSSTSSVIASGGKSIYYSQNTSETPYFPTGQVHITAVLTFSGANRTIQLLLVCSPEGTGTGGAMTSQGIGALIFERIG